MLRKIVWILPFLFFCLGYFIPFYIVRSHTFVVPSLAYLSLEQAIKKASSIGCGLQVIKEIEDSSQRPETVIYQSPSSGGTIKSHQSLHVIITKSPDYVTMSSLQGLPEARVQEFCTNHALSCKAYFLESVYPLKTCLAHLPRAQEPLVHNKFIAYYSNAQTSVRIVPCLKGKTYKEVKEFFESYDIAVQVVDQENIPLDRAIVTSQKPLAGSLIDIKKPLTVYITIKDYE